ncbi:lipocalin family protein [Larkinella arboricola]
MKQLILFVLILGVSISCHKADQDATPSNPLYQTWKLVESQNSKGTWESVSYESVLELRADGDMLYPKSEPGCCSPIRFERQDETLKITETYGGGDCIYVDCATPSAYKIVSVTASELVLDMVYGINQPVLAGIRMKYSVSK